MDFFSTGEKDLNRGTQIEVGNQAALPWSLAWPLMAARVCGHGREVSVGDTDLKVRAAG